MNRTFDTVYKRGKNGIVRWDIKIETRDNKVNIMMSYGGLDDQQVIRWQNNIKGKNIGKANETTPFEQAVLEAESKLRLRQKEGYKSIEDLRLIDGNGYYSTLATSAFLDLALPASNTDDNGNEIPMKCQQYYRSKKNWTSPEGEVYDDRKTYYMKKPFAAKEQGAVLLDFPCFIQPKINGVRCFVKKVNNEIKLFSKKGLDYVIPQVSDWFKENSNFFDLFPENAIFDGELYIEGESLQNIVSAVKVSQLSTLNVTYRLFDVAVDHLTQERRFQLLYSAEAKEYFKPGDAVMLVPTRKCPDDTRAQVLTDMYISEGYEGAIFRHFKGMYEFGKRPKTITKLKRLEDAEFMIVDVMPTEKDDTIGLFVCRTPQGAEFKVNPKGDTEYKRSLLLNPSSFIGKPLTIYFYEYTDDMIPFHITDNVVRDYE